MSVLADVGWTEHIFELPRFTLENGQTLAPLQLSYATIGTPEDDGANAILLLPTASGKKAWAGAHVGPNATFDPRKHFIISVDAIGGGGSSRPSLGLFSAFPAYSIRDNARLVHHLIVQHLGFRAIRAAGGASMGAMIALELALIAPALLSGLFLWSPSLQGGALFPILTKFMEILLADASDDETRRKALYAAGLGYFPALIGRGFLEGKSPEERTTLSRQVGEAFVANWEPHDLLSRYRSLATHDVFSRPEGPAPRVLAGVKPRCLLMPCAGDQLLPIEDARRMHAELPSSLWRPIRSKSGHWAASQPPGSPEFHQVQSATRAFLRTLERDHPLDVDI